MSGGWFRFWGARFVLGGALIGAASMHAAGLLNPEEFNDVTLDIEGDGIAELRGELYVPASAGSEPAALIVHLHGSGARGSDNMLQLDNQLDPLVTHASEWGYLVYAPQTPDTWSDERLADVARVTARLCLDYHVDPTRVYLTGISMGGGGAWVAITHYEGGYAAAVPMAGPAYSHVEHEHAVGVPIWNFHSRGDLSVSIYHSRSNINAVYTAASLPLPEYPSSGPDFFFEQNGLRLTELDGTRHAIAGDVFGNAGSATYAWLTAQRNDRVWLAPGETVRIDFGETPVGPTGVHHLWNSTPAGLVVGDCVAVPFARTQMDRGTGLSVRTSDGFDGRMTSGATLTILPGTVASDGWTVGADAGHEEAMAHRGAVRFIGLEPLAPYRLSVFGTWDNDDGGLGRSARYTVGDRYHDLDLAGNAVGTVDFDQVFADAEGCIELGVGVVPGTTTRWVSINAAWLTAEEIVCGGDTTGDGATNVFDLAPMVENFGMSTGATRAQGDLDRDGDVDTFDFSVFVTDFGCSN